MRWFRKHLRNVGIACAGVLFFLICVALIPLSAANAHAGTSGVATPTTVAVQATPTEDATVTALQKEQLEQEVLQLREQNAPDLLGWLRANAAILLSTLVVVIGGLVGLFRWFTDRRSEREKRAEERFQSAVTGLGDDKEGAKIGAAILLRTFLLPGYKAFYRQTFDLAVAHLRPQNSSLSLQGHPGVSTPPKREFPQLELPTTLRQALIMVFREAFFLARHEVSDNGKKALPSLDATNILLDHAYLSGADLQYVWMPDAFLRKAKLADAKFIKAYLHGTLFTHADLTDADLTDADLTWTDLSHAILGGANLTGADLSQSNLIGTNFIIRTDFTTKKAILCRTTIISSDLTGAYLTGADLTGANLTDSDFTGAYLAEADLTGADLTRANLTNTTLTEAKIETARSLVSTDLRRVKGLKEKQKAACKAKGAIIDDDSTTSASQSIAAPSLPSQGNSVQTSPTLHQENISPPHPGESSTASSQQAPES